MRAIVTLALKDLRLLTRDKAGLFFVVAFPLLFGVFFGFISASMRGGADAAGALRIVVVDEDASESSAELLDSLRSAQSLTVAISETREAAVESVRKGDHIGVVVIPEGYGAAAATMFYGDPPRIELGVDPSRAAEAGMLQGVLMQCGVERMQGLFTDPDAMRRSAAGAIESLSADPEVSPEVSGPLTLFMGSLTDFFDSLEEAGGFDEDSEGEGGFAGLIPLEIESFDVVPGGEDGAGINFFAVSFPQAILWGVMGAAAGFGISLVTERTHGTLLRLRAAPIGRGQILAGKALACFITTLAVAIGLLIFARIVFGVTAESPALLAMAIVSVAVCFVGVMMLLSVVGRTEASAGGIGWSALIVMSMIGGGMIPLVMLERIPFLGTLSHVSPVKWGILAIEGALWRGFDLQDMLLPCVILIGVGIVGFGAGARLFTRMERG